jgi:hypothetical protein
MKWKISYKMEQYDMDGMTPLMLAILSDNRDLFDYLILDKLSCDINHKDNFGGHALIYAVRKNIYYAYKLLTIFEGKIIYNDLNCTVLSAIGYYPKSHFPDIDTTIYDKQWILDRIDAANKDLQKQKTEWF